MLVLTRQAGTEILIDGRIRVTVLKVGGDRVRLGISAPPGVPIVRQELLGHSGCPASAESPEPIGSLPSSGSG